jgi:hypothetical protein
MVTFVRFERPVINLTDRLEQTFLRSLRVREHRPLELTRCAFVPTGRLRQVEQVTDVDKLIWFVIFDEPDYRFQSFP